MELVLLITAFVVGFAARLIGLPPLVGYLVAGFMLHALGYETSDAIETIAELGVLLLLFGIGLKLKLRTLARPEVWLDEWVAVDPTFGQYPADASHIRFVVGGLAQQVEIVRLIGNLDIEVLGQAAADQ